VAELLLIQEYKDSFHPEVTTVAEGEEACGKWACFQGAMAQIEENEIAYGLLGPNSNSGAISVLRKCQLPWMGPIATLTSETGLAYFGATHYLLGHLANGRSERKANYEDWLKLTNPYLIN